MTTIPDTPPPYGTVVFDCDSTLSRIEGIEELASDCRAEVEALTARAMEGALPLEEAYGARLALIQPTREDVDKVAAHYLREALPHAKELIAGLHALGKRVMVVSGGLLPAVLPFARELGINAPGHVHAVDIYFDAGGAYAGFDESSPLARSGGKISVLREISSSSGAGAVVLTGDGATDLEAATEVSRFIAYGGVARRANVFDASKITCEVQDLAALLPLLLSSAEQDLLTQLGGHEELLAAASS
ncbi:MAG: phosphoserine phosphatase [Planctomycetota bacterium]|jgi:phosphoserine phosphatase